MTAVVEEYKGIITHWAIPEPPAKILYQSKTPPAKLGGVIEE